MVLFYPVCRINVARETRLRKLRKNEGEEVGGGALSVSVFCLMEGGFGTFLTRIARFPTLIRSYGVMNMRGV